MQGRTRKVAAVGAAAFVLAGSAVLATPGQASADTLTAGCGQTVTAHPGDQINTPFGVRTVTDGLTTLTGALSGLLSGLCTITVNVVDTVVAPVPVVGPPLAGAINNTAKAATSGATAGTQGLTGAIAPQKGNQPAPQNPPSSGGAPQNGGSNGAPAGQAPVYQIPGSSSPVLDGGSPATFSFLPFGSDGYAPMRDYSDVPYALAGLFAPSPGVRYGGQLPGYAPEVGALGNGSSQQGKPVQNTGQAEALPGSNAGLPGDVGLPMLIAVLTLSGVSAALVRTWVLRGATT